MFKLLLITVLLGYVLSYKYLVFVPNVSNSQVQFSVRVAETLVNGGHNVTMLFMSHFEDFDSSDVKIPKGVQSYHLNEFVEGITKADMDKEQGEMIFEDISVFDERNYRAMAKFKNMFVEGCRKIVKNKAFFDWLRAEKFDVALAHVALHCPVGIIHHAGIPSWAWLNSGPMVDWIARTIGVPTVPSYVPPNMMESTDEMSFVERFKSFLGHGIIGQVSDTLASTFTEIFRDGLHDPSFPHMLDLGTKCPLVFVNTNELYDLPRPLLAKVINIGGLGVGFDSAKPLPTEFQQIVDSGKGTIVFSFGSIAPAHEMPESWKTSILEAFAEFPDYQFLMRYIKDDLKNRLPKNVHTFKWLPQKDLLLNNKTKAFITHGGYNSLQESISAGVPMITIALFADQPKNSKIAKKHGFAVNVVKSTLTKETVVEAIKEIIEKPSYQQNAKKFSSMVRRQPFKPSELLLRWSEFLAEFKTLDNLIPAGQKLNFFQYNSLDVIGTILAGIIVVTLVIFKTLKFICSKLRCSQDKLKQN